MALTITAANVLPGTGAIIEWGTAGETITAGQAVRVNTSSAVVKSDADASAEASVVDGIAAAGAASGQPIPYYTSGEVNGFSDDGQVGMICVASETAGGVNSVDPMPSSNFVTLIGLLLTASTLRLRIFSAQVLAEWGEA